MPDPEQGREPQTVSVVLCADGSTVERMGAVLRHLTVGLVDQAVSVRVAGTDPRIAELTAGPQSAVIYEPFVWPFARQRFDALLELLQSRPPTVVHACSASQFPLSAALAEEFDADLVLQVGSLEDCDAAIHELPRKVDAFVTPTKALLEQLARRLPDNRGRIAQIPFGIQAGTAPACFARAEGLPTVLCTSPWTADSGIDQLLRAMQMLVGRRVELLAFLWGGGKQEGFLRRLTRELGLSHCVTFVNPLGDPVDAMGGADFFVRPAEETAVYADPLHAMGAGLAVVACASVVSDFYNPGETAAVCGADAESMSAALGDLIEDRAKAQRLAASGQEYVRKHHAMSMMGARAAELYRGLALSHATFPMRE